MRRTQLKLIFGQVKPIKFFIKIHSILLSSAGVVLYAMMSGIFPFTETKNFSVSYQIMRGAYSFPDKYFAEVCDILFSIIIIS